MSNSQSSSFADASVPAVPRGVDPLVGAMIRHLPIIGCVAVVVAVVAYYGATSYTLHVGVLACIWAMFAMGWNMASGFGGMKAFGHQAFFALGGYSSALLAIRFEWSPWLTIWIGASIACLASLIVIAPVLRLRSAPQIAIVTLSFAELIRILLLNLKDLTNGEIGLVGIPTFSDISIFGLTLKFNAAIKGGYLTVTAIMLAVVVGLSYGFMRSRIGLAVIAVRDGPEAAESLGINTTAYRIALFAISAFIVGLAGAFYAHYITVITPEETGGLALMVMILTMTILGGMGTSSGPLIGAVLITISLEMFRAFDDYRMLAYGMLVILAIRFMPAGVTGLVARRAMR